MKEPSGSLVGAWNPRCSSRFTFAVSGVSGSDFAYCDVATKGMYSDIVITKIDGILKADKAAAMSQVLHAHQHLRASSSSLAYGFTYPRGRIPAE